MKMISVDDIVEYCNADIAHLYTRKQTAALATLRRVKEYAIENAIDAQPEKCGAWIETDKSFGVETAYKCSNCSYEVRERERGKYCPECGRKMKGGKTYGNSGA